MKRPPVRSTAFPALILSTVLAVACAPEALFAQDAPDGGPAPDGWRIVTDRVSADASDVDFVRMEPGFHVTTGPAALLFHPDSTAEGRYRVEATVHLFGAEEQDAGFGIFVGGDDLEGAYQRYVSFLLRPSGEFLVRHQDSPTSWADLAGWASSPAVRTLDDREAGEASIANELAVDVTPDELVFRVNGTEVHRAPWRGLAVEGVAGVRVGDGVDLHYSGFAVGAPAGE